MREIYHKILKLPVPRVIELNRKYNFAVREVEEVPDLIAQLGAEFYMDSKKEIQEEFLKDLK